MSNFVPYPTAEDIVKNINIADIEVVTLSRLLRQHLSISIVDSVKIARLVKYSHSLGIIRGKAVNNS